MLFRSVALGGVVGDLVAFGARRSSDLVGLRSLHLVGEALALTMCAWDPVLRLRPRCAVASSSGGVKLVGWCVGGRSGAGKQVLPDSSTDEAVGRRWSWWKRVLAVPDHRLRFRHCVAGGSCGRLQSSRCSQLVARWWIGFFCSGDGGGGFAVFSFAFLRLYSFVPLSVLCTLYSDEYIRRYISAQKKKSSSSIDLLRSGHMHLGVRSIDVMCAPNQQLHMFNYYFELVILFFF